MGLPIFGKFWQRAAAENFLTLQHGTKAQNFLVANFFFRNLQLMNGGS